MRVNSEEKFPIKIWASSIEEEAERQLRNVANLPFIFKWVAAMPDCLSEDTEALTSNGFKKIIEITKSDLVANVDSKTLKIFFRHPVNIINREKRKDEKIFEFFIEFYKKAIIQSENHRNFYINNLGITSKKIPPISYIKDYIWNGKGLLEENLVELKDEEICLIAWIVGDGNIKKTYNKNSINKRIRFGFKKQRKIDRVLEILNTLNLQYKIRNDLPKQVEIYINTEDSKKFINLVGEEKHYPNTWIKDLSNRQASLLLEELIKIDGDYENRIKHNTTRFNSVRDKDENFLSSLSAIHLGIANTSKRKIKSSFAKKDKDIYYIGITKETILKYSRSGLHNRKIIKKEINYTGKLVCLTCDSGFFVARRKGITFITGNCHHGKGATIGSVIATKGAILPAAVGVDIGCVDFNTEFLSPNGWIKISEYKDQEVLVYDLQNNRTFFEKPVYIKEPYKEKFLYFDYKFIDQALTPDHRCLTYKYDRSYSFSKTEVIMAKDISKEQSKLKLGFRHRFRTDFPCPDRIGVNLSDNELKLMVAVCADGSFHPKRPDNTYCSFRLSKKRKIKRLIDLCNLNQIQYKIKELEPSELNIAPVTLITLHTPFRFKCLSNLYNANKKQLQIICDEVFNWDGSKKYKAFYSKNKLSADFVSYAFAACGYRSVMITDVRKDDEIEYRVFANTDSTKVSICGSPKSDVKELDGDGFKYCFTTSTSFWIMRRNGRIIITGNCGMSAVRFQFKIDVLGNEEKLTELRHSLERSIPTGMNGNSKITETAREEFEALGNCSLDSKHLKVKNALTQCGSLGSGNHFIELCKDTENNLWAMLHSGSRNIGNFLAQDYIEKAKKLMEKFHIKLNDSNLSYFPQDTEEFSAYFKDLQWLQNYAKANRREMMRRIIKDVSYHILGCNKVEKYLIDFSVDCHHNYSSFENHYGENVIVTRKGAISARLGEWGIIPGSMGTKSYIVKGKGNPESFNSCSHGAGRKMSRSKAKTLFTEKDIEEQTKGVSCRKDNGVLDELPGAYKDLDQVMLDQVDLVEPVYQLKQLICIKG